MNLKELYQEIILDHGKNPRNLRKTDNFNKDAKGYNPLCGDKVHVYLKLNENKKRLFSGSIFERIIKDNEKFYLQVGAFSDQKNAEILKIKISQLGIKTVFINKARVNGKAIHRVRIGPIKTNELYNRVVDKLTLLSLNINIISE